VLPWVGLAAFRAQEQVEVGVHGKGEQQVVAQLQV